MAKTKYNPLQAFRDDPLAALKQATDVSRSEISDLRAEVEEPGGREAERARAEIPVRAAAVKSSAPVKPLSANLQTSRNTVYLYPEDLTKLRQLSGYAATEHGIRANDSMIVRAALSLLEADVRLLHALKETELLDRRRRVRT